MPVLIFFCVCVCCYTTELTDLIANIGKGKWKGHHIQAELYKAPSCICLKYIDTKRYDEEFISMYFESPRSKGGKVKEVQLLGNGEAVVTFENATGQACSQDFRRGVT